MYKNEPKIRIISSIFPVIRHSDDPHRQSRPSTCSNKLYTACNFNNNLMWSLSPKINGMHYFLTIKEPIYHNLLADNFLLESGRNSTKEKKKRLVSYWYKCIRWFFLNKSLHLWAHPPSPHSLLHPTNCWHAQFLHSQPKLSWQLKFIFNHLPGRAQESEIWASILQAYTQPWWTVNSTDLLQKYLRCWSDLRKHKFIYFWVGAMSMQLDVGNKRTPQPWMEDIHTHTLSLIIFLYPFLSTAIAQDMPRTGEGWKKK